MLLCLAAPTTKSNTNKSLLDNASHFSNLQCKSKSCDQLTLFLGFVHTTSASTSTSKFGSASTSAFGSASTSSFGSAVAASLLQAPSLPTSFWVCGSAASFAAAPDVTAAGAPPCCLLPLLFDLLGFGGGVRDGDTTFASAAIRAAFTEGDTEGSGGRGRGRGEGGEGERGGEGEGGGEGAGAEGVVVVVGVAVLCISLACFASAAAAGAGDAGAAGTGACADKAAAAAAAAAPRLPYSSMADSSEACSSALLLLEEEAAAVAAAAAVATLAAAVASASALASWSSFADAADDVAESCFNCLFWMMEGILLSLEPAAPSNFGAASVKSMRGRRGLGSNPPGDCRLLRQVILFAESVKIERKWGHIAVWWWSCLCFRTACPNPCPGGCQEMVQR